MSQESSNSEVTQPIDPLRQGKLDTAKARSDAALALIKEYLEWVSHRCGCGNRRVYWETDDWHTFENPSIRAVAY